MNTKEEFVSLVRKLAHERKSGQKWENNTLDSFLEALAGWGEIWKVITAMLKVNNHRYQIGKSLPMLCKLLGFMSKYPK